MFYLDILDIKTSPCCDLHLKLQRQQSNFLQNTAAHGVMVMYHNTNYQLWLQKVQQVRRYVTVLFKALYSVTLTLWSCNSVPLPAEKNLNIHTINSSFLEHC